MKRPRLRHVLIAAADPCGLTLHRADRAYNQITSTRTPYRMRSSTSSGVRVVGQPRRSAARPIPGAYQFSQAWNRVAGDHFPWLADTDPATVEPWWQDAMARALWSESGPSSWPHCGRRL
jgi:hypothetical protein